MQQTVEDQTFTITEMSHEFEITPRAIRFYEDKGLLSPARRGQARVYNHRDRVRLQLILKGKKVGFSLLDIKSMLDLYDSENGQVTQLTYALDKMRERIVFLKQQRIAIDETIEELEAGCGTLDDLLQREEKVIRPCCSA